MENARILTLRAAVEKRLHAAVSERVWEGLQGYCEEFGLESVDDAEGLASLVSEARRLRAIEGGPLRKQAPPPRRYREPRLAPPEEARSRVLGAEYSRLARRLPAVLGFRNRYIGKRLLTETEARYFLSSPAYRLMSFEMIDGAELPAIRLRSREVKKDVGVERLEDGDWVAFVTYALLCDWGKEQQRQVNVRIPVIKQSNRVPFQSLVLNPGDNSHNQFIQGSVIDELRQSAELLHDEFRWPFGSAVMFILTGAVPASPGISTDVSSRLGLIVAQGRITMEIQPWVPADVVRGVYQHARRWMLGQKPRRLKQRSLQRFARVNRLRAGRPSMTWRECAEALRVEEGDKKPPDWRTLARDYRRDERLLLHPAYAMGKNMQEVSAYEQLVKAMKGSKSTRGRKEMWESIMAEKRAPTRAARQPRAR